MKMIMKLITNGRVISAVVSALGAIISTILVGCKLYCGELTVKEFEASIGYSTNTIERITK